MHSRNTPRAEAGEARSRTTFIADLLCVHAVLPFGGPREQRNRPGRDRLRCAVPGNPGRHEQEVHPDGGHRGAHHPGHHGPALSRGPAPDRPPGGLLPQHAGRQLRDPVPAGVRRRQTRQRHRRPQLPGHALRPVHGRGHGPGRGPDARPDQGRVPARRGQIAIRDGWLSCPPGRPPGRNSKS